MQRFFSFVAGAFCGALIGAVAALLFAPMSGKDLQLAGRARADAMIDDVRHVYEEREAKLKAQLAALRSGKTPEPKLPEAE